HGRRVPGAGGHGGPARGPAVDGGAHHDHPARRLVVRHRDQQHGRGHHGLGRRRAGRAGRAVGRAPERLHAGRGGGHDDGVRHDRTAARVRRGARTARADADPGDRRPRPLDGPCAGGRRRPAAARRGARGGGRSAGRAGRLPALVRAAGRGRGVRLALAHREPGPEGDAGPDALRAVRGDRVEPVPARGVTMAQEIVDPLPFRLLIDEAVKHTRRHFRRVSLPFSVPITLANGLVPVVQALFFNRAIYGGATDPTQVIAGFSAFFVVVLLGSVPWGLGSGAPGGAR